MAYEKLGFVDNETPLDAAHFNHMEEGIANPDWNQMQNAPFGDMPTGGDTLEWDGNTAGLTMLDAADTLGGIYYKISDATPSFDEISTGTLASSNGMSFIANAQEFGGLIVCGGGFVLVVPTDDFHLEEDGVALDVPEKGIYSSLEEGIYASKIIIPGYTDFPGTKKIDPKYLPQNAMYVNSEEVTGNVAYLYADSTYTTKITKEQLEKICKTGNWVVYFQVDGKTTGCTNSGYANWNNNYNGVIYGRLGLIVAVNGTTATAMAFYTAEYPST